ncbi:Gcd10p family-domain-containing protein [Hysterangium stoloniferum]|nr:Gcd10p family-domain-containing protein [Hysterangium stoloniferum]
MNAVAGPSNVTSNTDDANISSAIKESSVVVVDDRSIKAGNTVLIRLPNAEVRSIVVKENSLINLGKFGSFYGNALIGQPFGLTYQITKRELAVEVAKPIEDLEETNATNELINDGEFVQPLTSAEIEALKLEDASADAIIKAQIEQHANYSLKTEYSKHKYRKRKEAKYSKTFTTLEPTLYHVADYWFTKDANRVREIRPDALAQMLSLANIHPGGRYLVVDDGGGLLVAGILERMGGKGRLLTIGDVETTPVYHVLTHMNFPESYFAGVLRSTNWAYTDEDWSVVYPQDAKPGVPKNEKQRSRMEKRKRGQDKLNETREDFFRGEWDGLVVSSQYDPYAIIETLEPRLAGSANIVVHHPNIQILADLHTKLRAKPQYLAPNVTEPWTRQYQVLPGRTHPLMTISGTAGFLLHAIKMSVFHPIYDDPNANAADLPRKAARAAKKRRMQTENGSVAATASAAIVS